MTLFDQVQFDRATHTYTLHGQELISVTTLLKRLQPPFDALYWSERKAPSLGMSAEALREQWDRKRARGLARGTRVHYFAEAALRGELMQTRHLRDEERAFFAFWQAARDQFTVLHTEQVVADAELGVAGSLDALLLHRASGRLTLWDWKTGDHFREGSRYHLLAPFADVPDCELHRYSLQLSLYWLIVERNTEYVIDGARLVHLAPGGHHAIYEAIDYRARLLDWLQGGLDA